MRAIFCCFLVLFLHIILSLDGVSSRHFDPQHAFAGTLPTAKPLQVAQSSHEGMKKKMMEIVEERGAKREINIGGSRPPSCEHKCYGCRPCEAIQVPTTVTRVAVQYTNYEPEAWKCKCGPTFYAP